MKNISIFYFSGTGNTWWAANRFAGKLAGAGFSVKTISVEHKQELTADTCAKSDIIFLFYPIYGSDRPEIIKEFISRLPDVPKESGPKQFGIVCTQLLFSGDGAWMEHQLIENRGYKINWALHLKMPNNISVPGFIFSFSNNTAKLSKTLNRSESRLETLAGMVSRNRQFLQGTSFVSNLLGLMQRAPFRKMLPAYQNLFSIAPDKCTRCGQCIKLCPVENIIFGNEDCGGFPEFQDSCNFCMRCYNFCPTQAIMYNSKPFRPKTGGREVPYRGPVDRLNPAQLKE